MNLSMLALSIETKVCILYCNIDYSVDFVFEFVFELTYEMVMWRWLHTRDWRSVTVAFYDLSMVVTIMDEKPTRISTWQYGWRFLFVGICVKPTSRDRHGAYDDIPCEFYIFIFIIYFCFVSYGTACGWESRALTTTWSRPLTRVWNSPKY